MRHVPVLRVPVLLPLCHVSAGLVVYTPAIRENTPPQHIMAPNKNTPTHSLKNKNVEASQEDKSPRVRGSTLVALIDRM